MLPRVTLLKPAIISRRLFTLVVRAIVVTTTARMRRVNSRRVMMAGFRRVTRGSMVPIPARPVGRSLWRRRAQAWFIDVTRAI